MYFTTIKLEGKKESKNVGSVGIAKGGILYLTVANIATVKIIVVNPHIYKDNVGVNRFVVRIIRQSVVVEIDTPFQIGGRNYSSVAGLSSKNL